MQANSESHALWRAPFRGVRSIDVRVEIPGSKSVTNRALILAALASTPSTLRKPLHSRDSELMIAGLRALGAEITGESELTVTPRKLMGPASIDVGNAGTVMRFLPPVAALAQGLINFDGDPRSHERPLAPVIKALASLGVTIEHGNRYSLPLTINGNGSLSGGNLEIDASASSQFVSALLLIGPVTKNGITLKHIGASLPSAPHIEMTIQLLRDFGAEVVVGKNEWRVEPGKLNGQDLIVEPDLSNAAPFLSIAMVCGGSITIADWPKNTTQPGDQLRELLSAMGAKIEFVESNSGQDLKLTGNSAIKGIDVDLHDVGELTPAIAALAALADSPSSLRGIGHLRMHETDRLAALAREINGLGGSVKEEKDALHITPAPLHGGTFHTYDDHRLATTGAVIGLVTEGVDVENIETTRKTLPDFSGLWKRLVN